MNECKYCDNVLDPKYGLDICADCDSTACPLSTCDAAFTNLWVRWMKNASAESDVRKQKTLCEDSFHAGWEEAEVHLKQNNQD